MINLQSTFSNRNPKSPKGDDCHNLPVVNPHNSPTESDLCVSVYISDGELKLFNAELDGENITSRSKYFSRGGKAGSTETRIAGCLLKMVKASLKRSKVSKVRFNLCDLARMLKDSTGKGVSDRTISRYLTIVLDKLTSIYGIRHQQITGQGGGYYIWHPSYDQSNQTFDSSLARRTKRKKDRPKILKWFTTTKRLARSKMLKVTNNKLPSSMIRLASVTLSKCTMPDLNRLTIPNETVKIMVAKLLQQGCERLDAVNHVFTSLRDTDASLSDFRGIRNPIGYAWHKVKSHKLNRLNRSEIRERCNDFWQCQLKQYNKLMDLHPEMIGTVADVATRNHIANKIKPIS